jgi:metal-responsive CopG/Arc/MetJ family transcriptional regulator
MNLLLEEPHHMVYKGVVGRTQVYLGSDELELLDRVSRETGASRSELIRRAVHTAFGETAKDERLQALRRSAGAWRDRQATSREYVDELRHGDLNKRLAELGLE